MLEGGGRVLAAYLFPEDLDFWSGLFFAAVIALGVLGPPAAFVFIVLKVFRRRREKILALDLGQQGRADSRQLGGGARPTR